LVSGFRGASKQRTRRGFHAAFIIPQIAAGSAAVIAAQWRRKAFTTIIDFDRLHAEAKLQSAPLE
jgi:hypothetical protein